MTKQESSQSPLTFVILGCGSRGQGFAEYIERHPADGRVVAVAEPDARRRNLVGDRHGIPQPMRFERWEDLLSRPKLADVAIDSLMDRLHAPSALRALGLGYHMLLEKPMAVTMRDCIDIEAAARRNNRIVTICHSLRYHPTYSAIKKLLDDGAIGQVLNVEQLEGVDPTHQAHSFVRGNWSNESRSTFMLMSKSCHDVDIICYLAGKNCVRVSSFGALTHFTRDNKPAGAPARCVEGCPVERSCPYSAMKHYLDGKGYGGWIGLDKLSEAERQAFIRTSPYGRCVYDSDNDVVDHQVVNFEFEAGVTGSFSMSAFAPAGRRLRLHGTKGFLESRIDEHLIELCQYWDTDGRAYRRETLNVKPATGSHGGGDDSVMDCLIRAIRENDASLVLTGATESMRTHAAAFAAERSRHEGRVVNVAEVMRAAAGQE